MSMMPVMHVIGECVGGVDERMCSRAASRPSRTGCRRFFSLITEAHLHPLTRRPFSLHSPPVCCEPFSSSAEITRLEEVFQAQQSGHVPMHDVDSNDARVRLWSVAAFNRTLKL